MRTKLIFMACLIVLTGCGILNDDVTIIQPKYRVVEGGLEQCREALIQDLAGENSLRITKETRKLYSMQAMSFFTLIQSFSEEMQVRLLYACVSRG
ncbi:MAG: hypothetical protein OXK72_01690 [Gammaproteobacteria bacterium]|nr:hypothetical protein [Gammaproteobacteria bacterium]MDE0411767.1 hypothetical protein [Gammaproteobacteria bacterium]